MPGPHENFYHYFHENLAGKFHGASLFVGFCGFGIARDQVAAFFLGCLGLAAAALLAVVLPFPPPRRFFFQGGAAP
ncbi:hypothetical protein R0J89_17680, partial [Psychrobacter sp. SIMBA_152]